MLRQQQFIERAGAAVGSGAGEGHDYMFYVDVVNFKRVNEQCGLKQADGLLTAMGKYLDSLDRVALWERVFSDRFLFLVHMEESVDSQRMLQIAHAHIRGFLELQRSSFPGCMLQLACGVSAVEDGNIVRAIDEASRARKEAKSRGAFVPVLYTRELFEPNEEARRVEAEIIEAWQAERICFFLQPKVNLKTGAIIGAEALARMVRPDGSLISPADFLPVAEENGAVIELDKLILRLVCAHLSGRIARGEPVAPVSLNLSRLHIYDQDTPAELHGVVQEYRLQPSLIEFEITETQMTKDIAATGRFVDALRSYGYMVSIDDFGAGYTGLSLLQELNVDTIKLDRKFLDFDEPYKTRNLAIVPNLISTAQRLNTGILCEGVETADHCAYLLGLGCDAGQGYFFSKPLPTDEFYRLLERGEPQFALPYIRKEAEEETLPKREAGLLAKIREYLQVRTVAVVAGCLLLLLALFYVTMGYEEDRIREMFIESVIENLDGFVETRVVETAGIVTDVEYAANAFAKLIDERNTLEFVRVYMQALNSSELDRNITYEFVPLREIQEILADENTPELSFNNYQELLRGRNIVSDVRYSEEKDMYWFGVGVPVYIDGDFQGAIKVVVDANHLVDTGDYQSPFGEIRCVTVSDREGTIMYANRHREDIGRDVHVHVVENCGVAGTAAQLESGLGSENMRTVRMLGSDGKSIYVSQRDLGFNDWKYTVVFQSNDAHRFSYETQTLVRTVTLTLTAAILMAAVVIGFSIRQVQRRASAEQKRYLLLSQFSDTILFDYSCEQDEMQFTENARQYYDLQSKDDLKQKDFLLRLSSSTFIYPGDQFIFRQMLSGMTVRDRYECRVRIRSREGRYVWCLVQFKFLYRAKKLISVVGKLINIDELYQREQRFRDMAMFDGATGLHNKAAATAAIREMLTEDEKGALIVVDMDNLKQVNDKRGHAAGDTAIRMIADCLKQTFRSTDVTGRIGGDEFIVYVRELCSEKKLAEKLTDLLALIHSRDGRITVSAGIACFPECGRDYDTLFDLADKALYAAKNSGKDVFMFSRPEKEGE